MIKLDKIDPTVDPSMIDEEEIPDDEDPVENQDEVKEEPIKLPPNLSKFSSQYKSYYNKVNNISNKKKPKAESEC